jgi:hypothetical protein
MSMDVRHSFIVSSSPNLANIMSNVHWHFPSGVCRLSHYCSIPTKFIHSWMSYTYATQNSTAFNVVDIFVPSMNCVVTPWPPRLIHGVRHIRGFLFSLFAAPCPVSGPFCLNPPALPNLFVPCVHCTMASGSTIGILELTWIYLDTRFDLNT